MITRILLWLCEQYNSRRVANGCPIRCSKSIFLLKRQNMHVLEIKNNSEQDVQVTFNYTCGFHATAKWISLFLHSILNWQNVSFNKFW